LIFIYLLSKQIKIECLLIKLNRKYTITNNNNNNNNNKIFNALIIVNF